METEVIEITVPKWNVEQFSGYQPITNYWDLFSIAEYCGADDFKDVLFHCFMDCGYCDDGNLDVKKLTELVMVLNHKIWQHYKQDEPDTSVSNKMSRMYNEIWSELDLWCGEHLTGDDADYYYRTLD